MTESARVTRPFQHDGACLERSIGISIPFFGEADFDDYGGNARVDSYRVIRSKRFDRFQLALHRLTGG